MAVSSETVVESPSLAKNLRNLLKVVKPNSASSGRAGNAFTNTFRPQAGGGTTLPTPDVREHLDDIFTERQDRTAPQLIKKLFQQDPDLSATVNAYLTTADTEPRFVVRDKAGQVSREGQKLLEGVLQGLTRRFDYTSGFELKPSLRTIAEEMRYMVLMRGGIAAEAMFDERLLLMGIRNVDLNSVEWLENTPGVYKPVQNPENATNDIDLDIPTFFTAFYRRDPTNIYTKSPFIAAINTIAARQQVVNDVYRIMQKTGYPRIELTVVEEVLRRNAPADAQADEEEMKTFINNQIAQIRNSVSNLRPDQAFVHTDAIQSNIMNQGGPRESMDVTAIMDVLNAQNQAALKTVATVIGRGESGTNTASTEARIFAMNAEEINNPVAEILEQILTLAIRLHGFNGTVSVSFDPVELRPEMELEPQKATKQQRLLELLSQGLITDDEFHLELFGRVRPDNMPELSGTGFNEGGPSVDTDGISPNDDPLGRSVTGDNPQQDRDNRNQ